MEIRYFLHTNFRPQGSRNRSREIKLDQSGSDWIPLLLVLDFLIKVLFSITGGQHVVEECIGVAQINIDKLMMRQLTVGWYKLFPPFDHR